MSIATVGENRAHGGVQGVYRHASQATGAEMTFAVFVPDHRSGAQLPVLWFLSGLTCTHANVTEKGEYRAACAEHGVIVVAPDTSPRGEDVPDDEAYDFGQGAGFYLDATQEPWARNYRMRSYIEDELPALIGEHFPADMARQGITGHSMGGHGALTIALRNPGRFRSVSAFAPIVAPSEVPWGEKAFGGYLGDDRLARIRRRRVDRGWRALARAAHRSRHGRPVPGRTTPPPPPRRGVRSRRHPRRNPPPRRLRPFLFLHLDLHGRACGVAWGAVGVIARRAGARSRRRRRRQQI